MMNIEHVISTMNRDEFSFLNHMQMKTSCLVVNQNRENNTQEFSLTETTKARIISTPEKGLSRSRNMLLKNAEGDICIMGDDDVEYVDRYAQVITQAYEKHPDADIIVFRFTHEKGKETRARFSKEFRMHLWHISKAASVEITFRRQSVLDAGLAFDERIGLGTQFPSAEENAFLADALRAGLKIYHVPVTICVAEEAHQVQSKEEVANYLMGKGAAFSRVYMRWFPVFAFMFVLLKRNSILHGVSLWEGYQHMAKGRKVFLNQGE